MEEMETKNGAKKSSGLDLVIKTISDIFTPVLPIITAAGILKALILLLAALHVLPEDSSTYYVLSFISGAGFYFLPLSLAYSASKHFGGTPYLALFLCSVLFHPDFTSVVSSGTSLSFLGLPIALHSYQSAVIPAFFAGWMEAVVEKFFRRHVPEIISFFAVPLLTTLICAPVLLIIVGPAGAWIGDGLCALVDLIHNNIGWPAVAILAALCPIIVTTGTSLCFLPLSLAALEATGFDPFTRTAFLCCNIAIASSALAVFVRSKIRGTKSIALQTSVISYMGITEPAIYGILLPLKRPFIASCIAAGIGGAFAGFTNVKAVAYASPSLITLPIFLSDTFVYALLTTLLTAVVSFVLTMILGFEDKEIHSGSQG